MLETAQRINDDTPRRISEIDQELRKEIRGLVSGELPWPFFLTGAPGRGKSAAALCLADHVADSVYYRFTRLLKAFEWARSGEASVERWMKRSTDAGDTQMVMRRESMKEWRFWDYLRLAPLVVIDDLATRGGYTEPQYDQFYDLIEDRKMRPTMIVSNVSLTELGKIFDERIVSRLARGTIFTLTGRDRRLDDKYP